MEWILVADGLPEANAEVIYCTRDGTRYGYYDGRRTWYYLSTGGYEKEYYEHDKVIAWMNLPQPYEETIDK